MNRLFSVFAALIASAVLAGCAVPYPHQTAGIQAGYRTNNGYIGIGGTGSTGGGIAHNRGVDPQLSPCPPGQIPGWHPRLGREVCAHPGDRNVIFRGQHRGVTQAPIPSARGCNNGQVLGYDRATGRQVCAYRGNGGVVFPPGSGGKDPFSQPCKNGGRQFGGRYVCMDDMSYNPESENNEEPRNPNNFNEFDWVSEEDPQTQV